MLDTNTVSYIIKGSPKSVREYLEEVPMASIFLSSISEAELLLGVAKKPNAKHLPLIINDFLLRVNVLPWDSKAANIYAKFRAGCESQGKSLGSMDMLIAAHAIATGSVLVTSDKAFYKINSQLKLEDWTK